MPPTPVELDPKIGVGRLNAASELMLSGALRLAAARLVTFTTQPCHCCSAWHMSCRKRPGAEIVQFEPGAVLMKTAEHRAVEQGGHQVTESLSPKFVGAGLIKLQRPQQV